VHFAFNRPPPQALWYDCRFPTFLELQNQFTIHVQAQPSSQLTQNLISGHKVKASHHVVVNNGETIH